MKLLIAIFNHLRRNIANNLTFSNIINMHFFQNEIKFVFLQPLFKQKSIYHTINDINNGKKQSI